MSLHGNDRIHFYERNDLLRPDAHSPVQRGNGPLRLLSYKQLHLLHVDSPHPSGLLYDMEPQQIHTR